MNKGVVFNTLKAGSYVLSLAGTAISGHRFKTFSKLMIDSNMIAPKLKSQLNIIENSLEPSQMKNVLFGTIETWLLWSITQEKVHATDITCASCTGMYDMYLRKWSGLLAVSLSVPLNFMPKVQDTCHQFGNLKPGILDLGYDVPVTAIIGDAQSSVIAECGYEKGDCVITMGTGSFISVNIGGKPLSSDHGFQSVFGYKHLDEHNFIMHGGISSAGVAIEWAKSIGLFSEYSELNDMLKSTENSDGVRFISAFGYLEMDGIDKAKVGTGFIGIKVNTTKAHMMRAVIDSIVFTIKIRYDLLMKDLKTHRIALRSVKVTGGVAQSDFICQYLANVLQQKIERSKICSNASLYGAAFLAGVGAGMWEKIENLSKLRNDVQNFHPENGDGCKSTNLFNKQDCVEWTQALQLYADWYKPKI